MRARGKRIVFNLQDGFREAGRWSGRDVLESSTPAGSIRLPGLFWSEGRKSEVNGGSCKQGVKSSKGETPLGSWKVSRHIQGRKALLMGVNSDGGVAVALEPHLELKLA